MQDTRSFNPGLPMSVIVAGSGLAQLLAPGFTYSTPWSDASSWGPGGVVPQEGDDVIIAGNQSILLDSSPPPLGHVLIQGRLILDDVQVSGVPQCCQDQHIKPV